MKDRKWWDRWTPKIGKAGHVVVIIGHVFTVLTGASFFFFPSVSVERLLSPVFALMWSCIFVVFGFTAALTRFKRIWLGEAVSAFAIAGGLIIWGVVQLYSTVEAGTFGAVQTGIRMLTGALILIGFGLLEIAWVHTRTQPSRHMVQAVVDAVGVELKRTQGG